MAESLQATVSKSHVCATDAVYAGQGILATASKTSTSRCLRHRHRQKGV